MYLNPEKIKQWLTENRVKRKDVARYLGVSYTYFCGVITGRNRVSPAVVSNLERLTGIESEELLESNFF